MPAMDSIGPFEQVILTAVDALRDNAYGFQVFEKACELAGKNLNTGSIYLTLERLYKKGYLTAVKVEEKSERGRQRTHLYKVTPSGLEALKAALKTQQRLAKSVFSRRPQWEHTLDKEPQEDLTGQEGTA